MQTNRYLLIYFVMLLFSGIQCSYIPFLGSSETDAQTQPLAYYVPEQRTDFVVKKTIKVNGDLNQVVNLLSDELRANSGVNVNVFRNSTADEISFVGTRELLKLKTDPIKVDSLEAFKEHFLLGYYILENQKYVIRPENMTYRIESSISIRGKDFFVDYNLIGSVDWQVYEMKKNGSLKKGSKSLKEQLGVSLFKTEREVETEEPDGEITKSKKTVVYEIKDQPVSKGTTELKLVDQLMSRLAVNNFSASVVF